MNFIIKTIKLFLQKVNEHHISAYAAQASYFIIMSAVPFCIVLITLIRESPLEYSVFRSLIKEMAPGFLQTTLSTVFMEASHMNVQITVLTSFSLLLILWATGRGITSLRAGLNVIHNHTETRNYIHIRILSTFYAVILAILLLFMIGCLVFGKTLYKNIGEYVPFLSFFKQFFLFSLSIRIIIFFILMTFLFVYVYRVFPSVHMPFHYLLPGAMSCSGLWLITAGVFSMYFTKSKNFSSTYGSLAAIMMLMLWLYVCMYEVLLCGELNVLLHPDSKPFKYSYFFSDEFKKL